MKIFGLFYCFYATECVNLKIVDLKKSLKIDKN